MKFFVPDWDDRVDPGYDFQTDRFSLVRDPYQDDVFAHELMAERTYDGMLVSRSALGEAGPKRDRIDRIGMRAYLRLPPELELFGDCGAFGYVAERDPVFTTSDVIGYYDRYGFDYGVSVDHLIVREFLDQRTHRYDLTLRNAEEFLSLHRQGQHRFTPIGAVQGWDVASYVEAAKATSRMGYGYIALGGLARSNTRVVSDVVTAVADAVPANVRIHVFGIARLSLLPTFLELGIASVDSAAPLRQAWLRDDANYYALERTYAAIRIPIAKQERPKAQTLVGRSEIPLDQLQRAEMDALGAVRAFDKGQAKMTPTLEAVVAYDRLLAKRLDANNSRLRYERYEETLRDRPWRTCGCVICREIGIEVIIFRGNNRNRRRGFHNLWVVRQRIDHFTPRSADASAPPAVRSVRRA
jgi:Queuine tRNA-ribosyltransferase